jgi:hypothetical membrane protein
MGFKEDMQNFYKFLTDLKVVKFSCITATLVWISSVIVAIFIAQFDPAGPAPDPAGFNILINYISDLGNLDLTPMPIIIDFGMMQSALLMIPATLYLRIILIGDGSKLVRKLLSNLTLICMLIAMGGFFLTGVISENVGEKLDSIFGPPIPNYLARFCCGFCIYIFYD